MDSPQRRISDSSDGAAAAAAAEDSARVGAAEVAGGRGEATGQLVDRAWELALGAAQTVDDIVHRHPYAALAASVAVGAAVGARRGRGRRRRVGAEMELVPAPARRRSLMRSVAGQAASLVATEALRIAAGLIADQRAYPRGADEPERAEGAADAAALDQPERWRRPAAAASAASAARSQVAGPGSRPPT